MRYLGGKSRIAKEIAAIINAQEGDCYLEPFMGSCWVTCEVKKPTRLAGDLHAEIVHLFHELCDGWVPPNTMTKELYNDIRANQHGDKYPKQLTAFALAGCAHYGSWARTFAGEKYAKFTHGSLMRKKKKLGGVKFFVNDYKTITPKNCVIYCDPPYAESYGFRICGTRGNGSFDGELFWNTMREWSKTNLVFISEISGPEDFDVLFEKTIKSKVRNKDGCLEKTERLFHMKPTDYDPREPLVEGLNYLNRKSNG
jgi:DNA adenine methylase